METYEYGQMTPGGSYSPEGSQFRPDGLEDLRTSRYPCGEPSCPSAGRRPQNTVAKPAAVTWRSISAGGTAVDVEFDAQAGAVAAAPELAVTDLDPSWHRTEPRVR
jgi:hypothetical protein